MIGVFISKASTFSAEVAGCQAECGAGSGEVIPAMDTVGKSICSELRCTDRGGLSVTETSKRIEGKLEGVMLSGYKNAEC